MLAVLLLAPPLAGLRRCEDEHNTCDAWAATDQCTTNEDFMRRHCAEACGFCTPQQEEDEQEEECCAHLAMSS